jgi:hypothetical protein
VTSLKNDYVIRSDFLVYFHFTANENHLLNNLNLPAYFIDIELDLSPSLLEKLLSDLASY